MPAQTICLDLRSLQIGHENRGIGMHIRSILENLPLDSSLAYIFYAYSSSDPIAELSIKVQVPYRYVYTEAVKHSIDRPQDFIELAKVIWHRYKLLDNERIDIFVQFDFMLGVPRGKQYDTLLVAYDLIPLIFKSEYIPTPIAAYRRETSCMVGVKKAIRALYYQFRYKLHYASFRHADSIVSISQCTTDSLVDILGVDRKIIKTIPLAPVFNTHLPHRPSSLPKLNQPFIFYIGATDARKRVDQLVVAFDILRSESIDISLILVGKEFGDREAIPNLQIQQTLGDSMFNDSIHTLGFIDDGEKLWLYQNAAAFVFPSLYEGFGLPVLEAMSQSCPVISYDNSSISEIAKESALLVPTGDIDALSSAIKRIISSPELARELRKRGKKTARKYTWKAHVTKLFDHLGAIKK